MIKEHDLGWLVVIEWSIRSNLQSQMMSDERPQVLDVENLTRAAGADTHTHTHHTDRTTYRRDKNENIGLI